MTAVAAAPAIVIAGPRPRTLTIGRVGLYSFLVIAAIFFIVPIYLMVGTSLKDMAQIRAGNGLDWPIDPSFAAWGKAWSEACTGLTCNGISVGFWNSVKILIPSVILSVLVGAINGYTLSFWRFRGSNLFYGVLIISIFIPYQVFVFPMIRMGAVLGLYGTLPGIVLIHVIFGMPITTLMFRNYYASLPQELIKAARVDGAGYFSVFTRIVVPMSAPIVVVALIWQATGVWNDYLFGFVFAGRDNLPMTVQLNSIIYTQMGAREYNVEMAATLLTALVPLIIYFISGKWFVRGITAGAVKG